MKTFALQIGAQYSSTGLFELGRDSVFRTFSKNYNYIPTSVGTDVRWISNITTIGENWDARKFSCFANSSSYNNTITLCLSARLVVELFFLCPFPWFCTVVVNFL